MMRSKVKALSSPRLAWSRGCGLCPCCWAARMVTAFCSLLAGLDQKVALTNSASSKNNSLTDVTYQGGMISVSDHQLRIIAAAAALLLVEARGTFLRRVVAELRERRDFNDSDIQRAVCAALQDQSAANIAKLPELCASP